MPVEPLSLFNLAAVMAIEDQSSGTHWTEDMLRRVMTDAYMRGAVWKEGAAVCGYCIFGMLAPTLEILNIVVDPNHRRQGIARRILTHIVHTARTEHCTEAFLEVRVSNQAAIQLYGALGFKVIDTRKKYYRDGEDALIMGATILEDGSISNPI
jgi:ribosomal-protein-alanine acetyltransferase